MPAKKKIEAPLADGAVAFEPVLPPRRMVFPMLGGGASPFGRSAALAGRAEGTAAAASGKTVDGKSVGGKSGDGITGANAANDTEGGADMLSTVAAGGAASADSDADDEFAVPQPSYSPFSTPADESDGDDWNRSLVQMEEGSEFITHPDDEGDEDSAGYGGSALAIGSLTKASSPGGTAGTRLPAEQPARIYEENSPQFQAALEKIPERAREALEGLLRVQYRHLEQRN